MSKFFQQEVTALMSLVVFGMVGISMSVFYMREEIMRVFAVDSVSSSVYQDTNGDGMVDRVRWTLDENVTACVYEAGDWTVDAPGDVNLLITGISCTGSDAILDISVTGDTNVTGGSTDPVLSYTNQGNPNDVTLTSGPMTDKLGVTVTDNASPSLIAVASNPQYLDTNGDGIVDQTNLFFTEQVDYTYDDTDWTATSNDLTGFDVIDCLSCTGANPLQLLAGANAGITGVSGGTEPTLEYAFLVNPIFDGVGNALLSIGPVPVSDNAAPTLSSAMYLDTNANGTVDTIRTTWTEFVSMNGSTAVDWTFSPGSINAVFASAPNDATDGLTLDILVTADANETGGALNPEVSYDNDDANNSIIDSPLAAGTTASVAVSDGASPSVLSWSLDLATETLTLNFTEPVDASTLAATGITVQDAATATQSVTLTGGTTASADGASIVVDLLAGDVTSIQGTAGLATTIANTFLRHTVALIDDLIGLDVLAIVDGSALQANGVTTPSGGRQRTSTQRVEGPAATEESAPASESGTSRSAAPQEDSEIPAVEPSPVSPSPEFFEDIAVPEKSLKRRHAMKMVAKVLGVSLDELEDRGIVKRRHVSRNKYEKRADFVAMVLKAKGVNITALPACEVRTYSDAEFDKSKWYCPVLEYARNRGWISETSGAFSPSGKVTKSWAAEILSRAFAR